MKTKIHFLLGAVLALASQAFLRPALASDSAGHLALAAKYEALAASEQAVVDKNTALAAGFYESSISTKSPLWGQRIETGRHQAALITAASKERAELLRFARWHRLEAAGSGLTVELLAAAQQGIIRDNQDLIAKSRGAYVNEKVTPRLRFAALEGRYRAAIGAAADELAVLRGYARWHELAAAGNEGELAGLKAVQLAVVAEHQKMKAERRPAYANEKVAPQARFAGADSHCDGLIADASRELGVLSEFAAR